jgi:hypothetical protein
MRDSSTEPVPSEVEGLETTELKNKMPDVDLVNRHPALQSMCSKD